MNLLSFIRFFMKYLEICRNFASSVSILSPLLEFWHSENIYSVHNSYISMTVRKLAIRNNELGAMIYTWNYNSFERLSYELLRYFKNRYFSGLMISSSKKKKMQRSKYKRYPTNIYLFKVNNKNTRTMSLTSFLCFNYLIAHISHLFLLFQLSTLNK